MSSHCLVVCRTCKAEKPASEMVRDRRRVKGYIPKCVECKLDEWRVYGAVNRQRIRERNRARLEIPEEHAKETERRRRFAREHPEVERARAIARRGTPKMRARGALKDAVRSGRIAKPSACQDCGRSDLLIHGHHHDYTKPLDVEWLCPPCHGLRHRKGAQS